MFSPIEVNTMITAGKDRLSGVLIKGVSEMSAAKSKSSLALVDVANDGFKRLLYGVLATVVMGSLLAAWLMGKLPKAVSGPIDALTKSVDDMTKGNLEQKVSANVSEFSGLATALERMRVSQQALVARMRARA
jgi:methyl-accepting chemotaxis protein